MTIGTTPKEPSGGGKTPRWQLAIRPTSSHPEYLTICVLIHLQYFPDPIPDPTLVYLVNCQLTLVVQKM